MFNPPTWWVQGLIRRVTDAYRGVGGYGARTVPDNAQELTALRWANVAWLLRDCLVLYGSHTPTCSTAFLGPCTCGLHLVLEWANAERVTSRYHLPDRLPAMEAIEYP